MSHNRLSIPAAIRDAGYAQVAAVDQPATLARLAMAAMPSKPRRRRWLTRAPAMGRLQRFDSGPANGRNRRFLATRCARIEVLVSTQLGRLPNPPEGLFRGIIDPRCPTNRTTVVGPRPGANEPKLHATEHDRARAVCLDDLTSRRQHPVRLVDPERHDRVGLLLIAETLVGVGGIEGLGCLGVA